MGTSFKSLFESTFPQVGKATKLLSVISIYAVLRGFMDEASWVPRVLGLGLWHMIVRLVRGIGFAALGCCGFRDALEYIGIAASWLRASDFDDMEADPEV